MPGFIFYCAHTHAIPAIYYIVVAAVVHWALWSFPLSSFHESINIVLSVDDASRCCAGVSTLGPVSRRRGYQFHGIENINMLPFLPLADSVDKPMYRRVPSLSTHSPADPFSLFFVHGLHRF